MQTLTTHDVRSLWNRTASSFGEVPSDEHPINLDGPCAGFVMDPVPLPRVLPLARSIAAWINAYADGAWVVWVFETGIWPSSENHHLYYTWRESKNDHTSIDDRPGHQFLPHEQNDVVTMVSLCLMFGWGFVIWSRQIARALRFDHDAVGALASPHLEWLAEGIQTLGLDESSHPYSYWPQR